MAQVSALAFKTEVDLAAMEAEASMDLSTIDEWVVKRIAALPGVERAEGFLTGYAATEDLPFFVVFGYHTAGRSIRHFHIVEGEGLPANRQIIMGRVAAGNLKKEVGQTIRIFNTPFRVVGIYETGVPFEEGGGVMSSNSKYRAYDVPRAAPRGPWETRSARGQFQLPVHEGEQFVPTREVEVAGEGSQIVEEGAPGAQLLADGLILWARQMQHGVK